MKKELDVSDKASTSQLRSFVTPPGYSMYPSTVSPKQSWFGRGGTSSTISPNRSWIGNSGSSSKVSPNQSLFGSRGSPVGNGPTPLTPSLMPWCSYREQHTNCCTPFSPDPFALRSATPSPSSNQVESSSHFSLSDLLDNPQAPDWKVSPTCSGDPGQARMTESIGFIDTHCHLDMLYGKLGFRGTFQSFRSQYSRSFPANFRGCVSNFCNPRLTELEGLWEGLLGEELVWGAFGCHPHFAKDYCAKHEQIIMKAMRHPKAIAFGEIGLDYSHKNNTQYSKQKEVWNVGQRFTCTHLADTSKVTFSMLQIYIFIRMCGPSVSVYVCVHVCLCVCVCAVHIRACTRLCVFAYLCVCMYTSVHMCVCRCLRGS